MKRRMAWEPRAVLEWARSHGRMVRHSAHHGSDWRSVMRQVAGWLRDGPLMRRVRCSGTGCDVTAVVEDRPAVRGRVFCPSCRKKGGAA